ncbi:hypothetical protein [Polynucleobacter sphagniphilus]|jgi:hypothetical protein|uniref:Uncharacterized protein n=1 Tax=Polynucleobacter sphagniphilus TaxID=1743169 RepID=A0AA43MA73_9BURK|nr:hypothetical protein [Polynucleobacter sphagniphilus]MDH6154469.1 hypothetical protein [Polynucleobacter sphagniphilus]MDH6504973.1 hypothetical protein [Polynucleobacter sphagniphilus]MDH6513542.1 hypothetical protein [Polynucleobacter sphagniphilus]
MCRPSKIWLCLLAAWTCLSFAQSSETSPYRPSFFLSPYQVEWDSNIDNIRTNYTINSPVLKNSANSINNNYAQKIAIGLPDNYSVGISDLYVQSIVSNPLNINAATPGFKNPVVSAAKIWTINSDVLLKALGSVQPNLGVKAGVSTYNLGISAIFIGPNDWQTSLGINETTNDAGYGGAPTLSGTISKQIGLYVINATAGVTHFPSILMTTGYASSSYLYSGTLELSRQLTDQLWLGASYSIGSNQYTYTQNFMSIPFNNRTLYNSVGASLKVLF